MIARRRVISRSRRRLVCLNIVVEEKTVSTDRRDVEPSTFQQLGSSSTTVFNIALAEKGSKLDKQVMLRKDKQGSMFRLQCDQHEFMQSFFLPVTNPYYGVAKDDGTFEIKDVLAGKHKLIPWHPFAGKVEVEVDVPEGGTVPANLSIIKN